MFESIGNSLHGSPVDGTEVKRLRDLVLFEGEDFKKSLIKFFCLLILASGISTYGLLSNSVATIIGAMIIAPLMLPIVGLAFGISIGDGPAIKNTLLISLAGLVTAIAVGFILSLPIHSVIQPESIDQIMSRTSPRLLDLFAALVTGVAGAFAMSRRDVSDTLPGVAIAISLVPPLANTGILLSTFNYSLALGSLLLFFTNYFAILLTGAAVFGLMGFSRAAGINQSLNVRRKSMVIVITMIFLISVPLGVTGYNFVVNNMVTENVQEASTTWLNGSDYKVSSVNAENSNNQVVLVVIGNGNLPPLEKLNNMLQGKLYGKTLQVEVVYSNSYTLGK